MTGADICDTETYTSAAGIPGKCSVLCINLIRGGDKDSLHNRNCKNYCEGCYAYYSSKVNPNRTASTLNATIANTTILPAITCETQGNETTAPFSPSCEITLTAGQMTGIVLGVLIGVIIVLAILLLLLYRNSKPFKKCFDGLLSYCTKQNQGGPSGSTEVSQNASHQANQVDSAAVMVELEPGPSRPPTDPGKSMEKAPLALDTDL